MASGQQGVLAAVALADGRHEFYRRGCALRPNTSPYARPADGMRLLVLFGARVDVFLRGVIFGTLPAFVSCVWVRTPGPDHVPGTGWLV